MADASAIETRITDYARGLVAHVDPEIWGSLCLLYICRFLPMWVPSWSKMVPYVRDNGCINDDGILLGHAFCVLDDKCTPYARERAAAALAVDLDAEFGKGVGHG